MQIDIIYQKLEIYQQQPSLVPLDGVSYMDQAIHWDLSETNFR
jgi:hypothetical protein